MDLFSFLSWFKEEWAQVKQAPAAFVAAVVVSLVLGTWVASWHYSGRLETLEKRVELRDDRIGELERQLAGLQQQLQSRSGSAQVARERDSDVAPRHGPEEEPEPQKPCTDFLGLTAAEIQQAGLDASPYDRPRIWSKYVGQCVRWTLYYKNLVEHPDLEGAPTGNASVFFFNKKDEWDWIVIAATTLERSPDLKFAHRNDRLVVEGRIKEISGTEIDLDDAKVSRLSVSSPPKGKK